jgi:hypothetical protein
MLSTAKNSELAQRTGVSADWYADGLVWPDYAGGGLFNLAVSLARACGADVPADYRDLMLAEGNVAASSRWVAADTLVFFLIDGLGDAFLSRNREIAPNLWRERVQSLTSVFPSTTATAITTLMTARPAAVHGLLGWYVRDEKTDSIVAPLPMRHRSGAAIDDAALLARLLDTVPMLQTATRESRVVTLPDLANGPYSLHHRRQATVHAYDTLDSLAWSVFRADREMHAAGKRQKFIYAYTPLLDAAGHDFGMESQQSRDVLARLDDVYAQMRRLLPEAQFVVSADHGFIDNPPEKQIVLSDHADLYAMLRGPLTGERRAAYCHVKTEYQAVFGLRIAERFGDRLQAMPAALAFDAGLFGPGFDAEALLRCGDWLLVPRDDWTVLDRVDGENSHTMLGVHGGLSAGEMQVPLILSPAL